MLISKTILFSLALLITQSYLFAAATKKEIPVSNDAEKLAKIVRSEQCLSAGCWAKKNLCATARILNETTDEAKKNYILNLLSRLDNVNAVATLFNEFQTHNYRLPHTMRTTIKSMCAVNRGAVGYMKQDLLSTNDTAYTKKIEELALFENNYTHILDSIQLWESSEAEAVNTEPSNRS